VAALDLGFMSRFRARDLPQRVRTARGGALRAAGALLDRNRQPLSGTGAAPRQGQHTGLVPHVAALVAQEKGLALQTGG